MGDGVAGPRARPAARAGTACHGWRACGPGAATDPDAVRARLGGDPWFEPSFLLLSIPGLLLTLVGSTVLGVALLGNGFRPRLTSWLLALTIPLALVVLQVTSMGNAVLPVSFAFGVAGLALAREDDAAVRGPETGRGRLPLGTR